MSPGSAVGIPAGGTAGLAAEEHADGEKKGGNGRVGQSAAQFAVVHAKSGVEKPDGRAKKPDPIEITHHSYLGCAG